jgi:hypothetical protein
MPSKHWLYSKTIWLNVAALVVALLDLVGQNFTALQGFIPPHLYAWLAFALPVVNGLLRSKTFQGIHFTTPPDQGAGGMS